MMTAEQRAARAAELSRLTGAQLLEAANAARTLFGKYSKYPVHPFEAVRGGRYILSKHTSLSRAEVIEATVGMEAGADEKHADDVADSLVERFAGWNRKDSLQHAAAMDANHYVDLAVAIRGLPRVVRLVAMAYVGLSDADLADVS